MATKKRTIQQQEEITAYLLLLPIFVLMAVFMYYPPLSGMVQSLFKWQISGRGSEMEFIGLGNYFRYFQDPDTLTEFKNLGIILLAGLVTGIVFPFTMAELLFHLKIRVMQDIYKRLIMIPLVIPVIVIVLVWKNMYDPALGPINEGLRALGLEGFAMNWLGEPRIALYAILFVGFPWVSTIGTLIFLGGLLQISESLFESARLEGAGGFKIFRSIEVPLLRGQFRLQLILTAVYAVTQFNHILVMTDGGPSFSTMVPGLSLYKRAFEYNEFGLASAIGVAMFVVAVTLTILINVTTKTKEDF